jgi:hypothetical protein
MNSDNIARTCRNATIPNAIPLMAADNKVIENKNQQGKVQKLRASIELNE